MNRPSESRNSLPGEDKSVVPSIKRVSPTRFFLVLSSVSQRILGQNMTGNITYNHLWVWLELMSHPPLMCSPTSGLRSLYRPRIPRTNVVRDYCNYSPQVLVLRTILILILMLNLYISNYMTETEIRRFNKVPVILILFIKWHSKSLTLIDVHKSPSLF